MEEFEGLRESQQISTDKKKNIEKQTTSFEKIGNMFMEQPGEHSEEKRTRSLSIDNGIAGPQSLSMQSMPGMKVSGEMIQNGVMGNPSMHIPSKSVREISRSESVSGSYEHYRDISARKQLFAGMIQNREAKIHDNKTLSASISDIKKYAKQAEKAVKEWKGVLDKNPIMSEEMKLRRLLLVVKAYEPYYSLALRNRNEDWVGDIPSLIELNRKVQEAKNQQDHRPGRDAVATKLKQEMLNQKKLNEEENIIAEALPASVDESLSDDKMKAIRECDRWLIKNMNVTGITGNSKESFVSNLLSLSARERLYIYYIIEKRRRHDANGADTAMSQSSYVPNVDKFKSEMTASFLKIFKRFTGGQIYWHKLSVAMQLVQRTRKDIVFYAEHEKKTEKTKDAKTARKAAKNEVKNRYVSRYKGFLVQQNMDKDQAEKKANKDFEAFYKRRQELIKERERAYEIFKTRLIDYHEKLKKTGDRFGKDRKKVAAENALGEMKRALGDLIALDNQLDWKVDGQDARANRREKTKIDIREGFQKKQHSDLDERLDEEGGISGTDSVIEFNDHHSNEVYGGQAITSLFESDSLDELGKVFGQSWKLSDSGISALGVATASFSSLAFIAAAISFVGSIKEVVENYGTLSKGGVTMGIAGSTAAFGYVGSAGVDLVSQFVATPEVLGTVATAVGAGASTVLLTLDFVNLYKEGKQTRKLGARQGALDIRKNDSLFKDAEKEKRQVKYAQKKILLEQRENETQKSGHLKSAASDFLLGASSVVALTGVFAPLAGILAFASVSVNVVNAIFTQNSQRRDRWTTISEFLETNERSKLKTYMDAWESAHNRTIASLPAKKKKELIDSIKQKLNEELMARMGFADSTSFYAHIKAKLQEAENADNTERARQNDSYVVFEKNNSFSDVERPSIGSENQGK